MPVDDNHTTTHSSLLSLCTNGQNSSGTLNLFSGLCCSAHSGVSQSVNLPPQAPLSDFVHTPARRLAGSVTASGRGC